MNVIIISKLSNHIAKKFSILIPSVNRWTSFQFLINKGVLND